METTAVTGGAHWRARLLLMSGTAQEFCAGLRHGFSECLQEGLSRTFSKSMSTVMTRPDCLPLLKRNTLGFLKARSGWLRWRKTTSARRNSSNIPPPPTRRAHRRSLRLVDQKRITTVARFEIMNACAAITGRSRSVSQCMN